MGAGALLLLPLRTKLLLMVLCVRQLYKRTLRERRLRIPCLLRAARRGRERRDRKLSWLQPRLFVEV